MDLGHDDENKQRKEEFLDIKWMWCVGDRETAVVTTVTILTRAPRSR